MSIILGKSIDLRIMNEYDIEEVRMWRNSKDVSNFMLSKTLILKENQQKWYESIKNNSESIYFIIVSKEGEKLGVVNFSKIDDKKKTAEPGLYIGSIKHRNSLYGIEAYFHLLNFGFNSLKLKKIYGTVLSSNKVAVKMNASFGFSHKMNLTEEIVIDEVQQTAYKIWLFKKNFYASPMAKFFNVK